MSEALLRNQSYLQSARTSSVRREQQTVAVAGCCTTNQTSLLLSQIWREHAKQEEFQCFSFRNFIANLISSSNVGDMRNRFIVTILLHQNKLTSNAMSFRLSNRYLSIACAGALIF